MKGFNQRLYKLGVTALFCTSYSMAATEISACEKSYDIDGKGTRQFFDKNGWIFESWEFKDEYKLTRKASDSLELLNKTLQSVGSHLILVPTPFRSIKYAESIISNKNIQNFSKKLYIENWNQMMADAKSISVDTINLLPQIIDFKTSNLNEEFYYPRDHHWTTSGALVAAKDVAIDIARWEKISNLNLEREENSINISKNSNLFGSFSDNYASSCGIKPENMDRYDVTIDKKNLSLLEDQKVEIGIFGDSFGQAYPDNNFSEFLENQTQMAVANYSVSGGGATLPMAGYFADAAVRGKLPPLIVVPFQGWISNNDFDYDQSTAALIGCNADRMISSGDSLGNSASNSFAPKVEYALNIRPAGNKKVILHVHTSLPTNYLEVRGNYKDNSPLNFEIYRTSADYFKGSRNDFYSIIPEEKPIGSISVKIEDGKAFNMHTDLCYLK